MKVFGKMGPQNRSKLQPPISKQGKDIKKSDTTYKRTMYIRIRKTETWRYNTQEE